MLPIRIDNVSSKIAIFKHPEDTISNNFDAKLVSEIVEFVNQKTPLPGSFGACGPTTIDAFEFCRENIDKHKFIKAVWITLSGKEVENSYHGKCGARHQVPLIYYQSNFYFFDFFNFYAEKEPNVVTSVIIFPTETFNFEKMIALTGSQPCECRFETFPIRDLFKPVDMLVFWEKFNLNQQGVPISATAASDTVIIPANSTPNVKSNLSQSHFNIFEKSHASKNIEQPSDKSKSVITTSDNIVNELESTQMLHKF
jgi:hypothetical protein